MASVTTSVVLSSSIRSIELLPEIFRSDPNRKFLAATLDQLISEPNLQRLDGLVGRQFSPTNTEGDYYIAESTNGRQNYQLEPAVVVQDSANNNQVTFYTNYPDLIEKIAYHGGISNDHSRLFSNESYNFNGLIDFDKLINFNQYLWLPDGPPTVIVSAISIVSVLDFTVTRDTTQQAYTFTGLDKDPNPALTLVKGETYTFSVNQPGNPFWLQTVKGRTGTYSVEAEILNRQIFGVTNNGTDHGVIKFQIPTSGAQDKYLSATRVADVDFATELTYAQIQNHLLSQVNRRGGLDGITNSALNGRLVIFLNPNAADTAWTDPGVFDYTGFDQEGSPYPDRGQFSYGATVNGTARYGIFQIRIDTSMGGLNDGLITLTSYSIVDPGQKVYVKAGTTNTGVEYLLDAEYRWEPIPPITSVLSQLYYQDGSSDDYAGIIQLVDPGTAVIDVVNDVIGKTNYTSRNGVKFTNGMQIEFDSTVVPGTYQNNKFIVEGVGTAIKLIPVGTLLVPEAYASTSSVPLSVRDYITISRASQDLNAWTRSNRWFHSDLLTLAAQYNKDPGLLVTTAQRAIRPIIEFEPDIFLFGYGTNGKAPVDIIDFSITDAFTQVEGKSSYIIQLPNNLARELTEGTRIIFAADQDPVVRQTIYRVTFLSIASGLFIHLVSQNTDLLPTYSVVGAQVLEDTTVSFVGGNPTIPAAANLIVDNITGTITDVVFSNYGQGYISTPQVIFSSAGQGAGAILDITVRNGSINGYNLVSGGAGYAVTPSYGFVPQVTFTSPVPSIGAVTANATAVLSPTFVTNISVSYGGLNYIADPYVVVGSDYITQATVQPVYSQYLYVDYLRIVDPLYDYSTLNSPTIKQLDISGPEKLLANTTYSVTVSNPTTIAVDSSISFLQSLITSSTPISVSSNYLIYGPGVTGGTTITSPNIAITSGYITGTNWVVQSTIGNIQVGMGVLGNNILAGTTVTAINTPVFTGYLKNFSSNQTSYLTVISITSGNIGIGTQIFSRGGTAPGYYPAGIGGISVSLPTGTYITQQVDSTYNTTPVVYAAFTGIQNTNIVRLSSFTGGSSINSIVPGQYVYPTYSGSIISIPNGTQVLQVFTSNSSIMISNTLRTSLSAVKSNLTPAMYALSTYTSNYFGDPISLHANAFTGVGGTGYYTVSNSQTVANSVIPQQISAFTGNISISLPASTSVDSQLIFKPLSASSVTTTASYVDTAVFYSNIAVVAGSAGIQPGYGVFGEGVPLGTKVIYNSVLTNTVTLSQPAYIKNGRKMIFKPDSATATVLTTSRGSNKINLDNATAAGVGMYVTGGAAPVYISSINLHAGSSTVVPVAITTSTAAGLITGDQILIRAVQGTTEINDKHYYVSVDASGLILSLYTDSALIAAVDGRNFSVYVTGGIVAGFTVEYGITVTQVLDPYNILVSQPLNVQAGTTLAFVGRPATATVTAYLGVIKAVTVTDPGAGYTITPNVNVIFASGGSSVQIPIIQPIMNDKVLNFFKIVDGGSGYQIQPSTSQVAYSNNNVVDAQVISQVLATTSAASAYGTSNTLTFADAAAVQYVKPGWLVLLVSTQSQSTVYTDFSGVPYISASTTGPGYIGPNQSYIGYIDVGLTTASILKVVSISDNTVSLSGLINALDSDGRPIDLPIGSHIFFTAKSKFFISGTDGSGQPMGESKTGLVTSKAVSVNAPTQIFLNNTSGLQPGLIVTSPVVTLPKNLSIVSVNYSQGYITVNHNVAIDSGVLLQVTGQAEIAGYLASAKLTGINITDGGTGYTCAPKLTIESSIVPLTKIASSTGGTNVITVDSLDGIIFGMSVTNESLYNGYGITTGAVTPTVISTSTVQTGPTTFVFQVTLSNVQPAFTGILVKFSLAARALAKVTSSNTLTFNTSDLTPEVYRAGDTVLVSSQTVGSSDILQSLTGIDTFNQYYFDGTNWLAAQPKISYNQTPRFDIFDSNGASAGDNSVYQGTKFVGTPIFSYSVGSSGIDPALGFALQYQNFNNVGDIVFVNNFDNDSFSYLQNNLLVSKKINTFLLKQKNSVGNIVQRNVWTRAAESTKQYQVITYFYDGVTNYFAIDILPEPSNNVPYLIVYVDNQIVDPNNYIIDTVGPTGYAVVFYPAVTLKSGNGDIAANGPSSKIDILIYSHAVSNISYYQIPMNLEYNSLNATFDNFTLGQLRQHLTSMSTGHYGMTGSALGKNNLRDLSIKNWQGTILQHSGPAIYSAAFLGDNGLDFVSAVNYAQTEYSSFKDRFLNTIVNREIDVKNIPAAVDQIMGYVNLAKNTTMPWYDSDMVPYGNASTTTNIPVVDVRKTQYQLTQAFDDTQLSRRAVLIYRIDTSGTLPDRQLIKGIDFNFVADLSAFVLSPAVELNYTCVLRVVDWPSTVGCYIPETPTKLGLYPKFVPKKYLDTSYQIPVYVIQGHDGSITPAFHDARDDLLLELELRIYNNIKVSYNDSLINLYSMLPGKFRKGTTDYSRQEFNRLLTLNFLNWIGTSQLDYVANTTLSANNPWTWNYNTLPDPTGELLPGFWRGIYQYFYDTDRPNIAPWEMLGFSEKPLWWEDYYGPAPYTGGNSVLWKDLEQGMIAGGPTPGVNPLFARPGLHKIIPVDDSGNLINPSQILISQYNSNGIGAAWAIGDQGPVESAWRKSSSFPYAVQLAIALAKPAFYFGALFDVSVYNRNADIDQIMFISTKQRVTPATFVVPDNGIVSGTVTLTAGYTNWVRDYYYSLAVNGTAKITDIIRNLQTKFSYRMAGYTDPNYMIVMADQSSPATGQSSIIVPKENYKIFVNKSAPVNRIIYSAVVVTKTSTGFAVSGYNTNNPYFTVIPSTASSNNYNITAQDESAVIYRDFQPLKVTVPYGYQLRTRQQVVDFLTSYGRFLIGQGMVFDTLNSDLGVRQDWALSATEFLTWSQQGWGAGSTIVLSPVMNSIKLINNNPPGVIDQIYGNLTQSRIMNQNFVLINPGSCIVVRENNTFSMTVIDGQTIALADLNLVQYEHVLLLDNRTVFNDVIYDPALGNRQYRIRLKGSRTAQWTGQLNPPGFVYNSGEVDIWQAGKTYVQGSMVDYKNNYYFAGSAVPAALTFDFTKWTLYNKNQFKTGMLPNFSFNAEKFNNVYDIDNPPADQQLNAYSLGMIGFRERSYLKDLDLDMTSQGKLYQGFVSEKGSLNAINAMTKGVFARIASNISLYEEYGFRVGEYGAVGTNRSIEFILDPTIYTSNPSTTVFLNDGDPTVTGAINLTRANVYDYSTGYSSTLIGNRSDITPRITDLVSAGYPRLDDVDGTMYDITQYQDYVYLVANVGIGYKLWVASDFNGDWNVYRANEEYCLITQIALGINNLLIIDCDGPHKLLPNDFIAIKNFNQDFDGFYRVISLVNNTSFVVYGYRNVNLLRTLQKVSGTGVLLKFSSVRVKKISQLTNITPLYGWQDSDRIWVDNDTSDNVWGVYQKTNSWPFDQIVPITSGTVGSGDGYGTSIRLSKDNSYILAGTPNFSTGSIFSCKVTSPGFLYANPVITVSAPTSESTNAVTAIIYASPVSGNLLYARSTIQYGNVVATITANVVTQSLVPLSSVNGISLGDRMTGADGVSMGVGLFSSNVIPNNTKVIGIFTNNNSIQVSNVISWSAGLGSTVYFSKNIRITANLLSQKSVLPVSSLTGIFVGDTITGTDQVGNIIPNNTFVTNIFSNNNSIQISNVTSWSVAQQSPVYFFRTGYDIPPSVTITDQISMILPASVVANYITLQTIPLPTVYSTSRLTIANSVSYSNTVYLTLAANIWIGDVISGNDLTGNIYTTAASIRVANINYINNSITLTSNINWSNSLYNTLSFTRQAVLPNDTFVATDVLGAPTYTGTVYSVDTVINTVTVSSRVQLLIGSTITFSRGTGGNVQVLLAPTSVSSISVQSPVSGFTSGSVVIEIYGGNGSGAVALATVSSGTVTNITVVNGGSGYTTLPYVKVISINTAAAAQLQAQLQVYLNPSPISSLIVGAPGMGYAYPTLTLNKLGILGSGATAALTITNGSLLQAGITIRNPGAGYIQPPVPTVSDANSGIGSGAQVSIKIPTGLVKTFSSLEGTITQLQNITQFGPDALEFGTAIDIGSTYAVIGAPGTYNNSGAALITQAQHTTWTPKQMLYPADLQPGFRFGSAIAMSQNELWIYIGASGGNRVYAYAQKTSDTNQQKILITAGTTSYQTNFISIKSAAELSVVGGSGKVYVPFYDFDISAGVLSFTSSATISAETVLYVIQGYLTTNITSPPITATNPNPYSSAGVLQTSYQLDITPVELEQVSVIGASGRIYIPGLEYTLAGDIITFITTEFTTEASIQVTVLPVYWVLVTTIYPSDMIQWFNNVSYYQHQSIAYTVSTQSQMLSNIYPVGSLVKVLNADTNGVYQIYANTQTTANTYTMSQVGQQNSNIVAFGSAIASTSDGYQIVISDPNYINNILTDLVGNPLVTNYSGKVYVYDRSYEQFVVTGTAKQYTTVQPFAKVKYVTISDLPLKENIDYIVSDQTVTFTKPNTIGQLIRIQTNQFNIIQAIENPDPVFKSYYGQTVAIAPDNSNIFVGAPGYRSIEYYNGRVYRYVNQALVYGSITGSAINPQTRPNDTLRINSSEIIMSTSYGATTSTVRDIIGAAIDGVSVGIDGISSVIIVDPGMGYFASNVSATVDDPTVIGRTATVGNITLYANGSIESVSVIDPGTGYLSPTPPTVTFFGANSATATAQASQQGGNLKIYLTPGTLISSIDILPGIGTSLQDLGLQIYVPVQILQHPNTQVPEHFGTHIAVDPVDGRSLVVASGGGSTLKTTTFDKKITRFDSNSTAFIDSLKNSGSVYVYDYLQIPGDTLTAPSEFLFNQILQDSHIFFGDNFGSAVAINANVVLVGANNSSYYSSGAGVVHRFVNSTGQKGWSRRRTFDYQTDVGYFNSAFIYDNQTETIDTRLDYFDPAKGKILGEVDQYIDYKTIGDPAQYNTGTNSRVTMNDKHSWNHVQVGQVWWNLLVCKIINYEQGELAYRTSHWGEFFPGSMIQLLEWVESSVLPSQHVAAGNDGIPLYANDSAYSMVSYFDEASGLISTRYYYWVSDKVNVDELTTGRTTSLSILQDMIANPINQGIPYIAALRSDAIGLFNGMVYMKAQQKVLKLEYAVSLNQQNYHNQYQLLQRGNPDSVPPAKIINKLIDSLALEDIAGNPVPDLTVNEHNRLGINIRPRQTMIKDVASAFAIFVGFVNNFLSQNIINGFYNLSTLTAAEPIPASGYYDLKVATVEQLNYIVTAALPAGYLVLIEVDSTTAGFWTIYEWRGTSWVLVRIQSYDSGRYIKSIDWYKSGYGPNIQFTYMVKLYADLKTLKLKAGDIVKVLDNGSGLFEIYAVDNNLTPQLVGVQNGTIQLETSLYDSTSTVGFDNTGFDSVGFSKTVGVEVRNIINGLFNDVFINNNKSQLNELFFIMIEYILSEQKTVDWLFKSSFISVLHQIRKLEQFKSYVIDQQTYFENYLNEVKPFRSILRNYTLDYIGQDDVDSSGSSDFDLPAVYDSTVGAFVPANYRANAQVLSTNPVTSAWYVNHSYSIQYIEVSHGGYGYSSPPQVIILGGGGSGATAEAAIDIESGQLVSVTVLTSGSGYTTTPVVNLVGGNGVGAVAYPVFQEPNSTVDTTTKNKLIRSISTQLNFDRIAYTSKFRAWKSYTTYHAGDILSVPSTSVTTYKNINDQNLPTNTIIYKLLTNLSGAKAIDLNVLTSPNVSVRLIGNDINTVLNAVDRVALFNYPGSPDRSVLYASADTQILTSSNTNNEVSSSGNQWNNVVHSKVVPATHQYQYLAVGNRSYVAISKDGEHWTAINLNQNTVNLIGGVFFNHTTWYAVGNSGAVYHSTDAVTWNLEHVNSIRSSPTIDAPHGLVTTNTANSLDFTSVGYFAGSRGSYVIVVGNNNNILVNTYGTSVDLVDPQGITLNLPYTWYNVRPQPGSFLSLQQFMKVFTKSFGNLTNIDGTTYMVSIMNSGYFVLGAPAAAFGKGEYPSLMQAGIVIVGGVTGNMFITTFNRLEDQLTGFVANPAYNYSVGKNGNREYPWVPINVPTVVAGLGDKASGEQINGIAVSDIDTRWIVIVGSGGTLLWNRFDLPIHIEIGSSSLAADTIGQAVVDYDIKVFNNFRYFDASNFVSPLTPAALKSINFTDVTWDGAKFVVVGDKSTVIWGYPGQQDTGFIEITAANVFVNSALTSDLPANSAVVFSGSAGVSTTMYTTANAVIGDTRLQVKGLSSPANAAVAANWTISGAGIPAVAIVNQIGKFAGFTWQYARGSGKSSAINYTGVAVNNTTMQLSNAIVATMTVSGVDYPMPVIPTQTPIIFFDPTGTKFVEALSQYANPGFTTISLGVSNNTLAVGYATPAAGQVDRNLLWNYFYNDLARVKLLQFTDLAANISNAMEILTPASGSPVYPLSPAGTNVTIHFFGDTTKIVSTINYGISGVQDHVAQDIPVLVPGTEYPGVKVTGQAFTTNDTSIMGLDTIITGSYRDTALGSRPEDIIVEGGAYIDTYSSFSPEELVPGQTLDSLQMNVFTANVVNGQIDYGNVIAFKIFTDDVAATTYYRLSAGATTSLSADLGYLDTNVYVVNAALLPAPNATLNQPGSIWINGERINYFGIDTVNNVLTNIRRGAYRTSIPRVHPAGSLLNDATPVQQVATDTTLQLTSDISVTGGTGNTVIYQVSTTASIYQGRIWLS